MAEQQQEQEGGRKRGREEEGQQQEPDAKRLCESLLCEDDVVDGEDLSSIIEEAEHSLSRGILDDDDEAQEEEQGLLDETQEGLVSDVMRSLEEELGVSSESSSDCGSSGRCAAATELCCTSGSSGESRLDFGYLLEASDDELGIEPSPSSDKFDDTTTEKLAVVEAEDLVRGESWDNSNWSAACAGFPDDGFMDDEGGQQQEWLKRTLEMFMGSSSAAVSASSPPTLPMFEPTTPLLEAGVIL